jgi:hypothetical protein
MQTFHTKSQLVESQGQSLRAQSRLGKDYSLPISILVQKINQVAILHLRGDENIELLKVGNCLIFLADFHSYWIFQGDTLQFLDLACQRRRKEIRPPILRDDADDTIELLLEILVQQFISFIQHQKFNVIEMKPFGVLQMIQNPSRSGDNNIRFLRDLYDLLHRVDASIQDQRTYIRQASLFELVEVFVDLDAELPRRTDNQCQSIWDFFLRGKGLFYVVEDRKHKRKGLSAACLGQTEKVLIL